MKKRKIVHIEENERQRAKEKRKINTSNCGVVCYEGVFFSFCIREGGKS